MVVKTKFRKSYNFRELLRTTIGKDNWNIKKPIEKWSYLYGIGELSGYITGLNWFDDSHTLRLRGLIMYTIGFFYLLLAIYTICLHYIRGDFKHSLTCTCLLVGPIFTNIPMLLLSFMTKPGIMINSMINFGGKYIYSRPDEDPKYYDICSKHLDSTVRTFFTKMLLISASFSLAVIGPVNAYLTQGVKTSTTDVRIPFTDMNSNAEFIGNMTLQFSIASLGFVGYIIIETGMALFDDFITIAPKLIKYKLEKMDKSIETKQYKALQINVTLKDIIKQSLDSDNYVTVLNDLLYYRTLLTPPLFTYAISMSIFCQYTMNFAAGYGMAMMSWVQLFFICEVGESTDAETFSQYLYDSNWYALPLKNQRAIMFLIKRKQNSPRITFGPLGNINRDRFKLVTNKIYSFLMYLLNFRD